MTLFVFLVILLEDHIGRGRDYPVACELSMKELLLQIFERMPEWIVLMTVSLPAG